MNKKYLTIVILAILLIIIGIYFWYCNIYSLIKLDKLTEAGQYGDSFGFFNSISMILLFFAIVLQTHEIYLQRIEFNKQIEVWKETKEEQVLSNSLKREILIKTQEFTINLEKYKMEMQLLNEYYSFYNKYFSNYLDSETKSNYNLPNASIQLAEIEMATNFFVEIFANYINDDEYFLEELEDITLSENQLFYNIKNNLDIIKFYLENKYLNKSTLRITNG